MTRIVVDPDGTRWVSVDVDAATMSKLRSEFALERFQENVNREFWRRWAEKLDSDLTGLCR